MARTPFRDITYTPRVRYFQRTRRENYIRRLDERAMREAALIDYWRFSNAGRAVRFRRFHPNARWDLDENLYAIVRSRGREYTLEQIDNMYN